MRWRIAALVSLGVNVVLFAFLLATLDRRSAPYGAATSQVSAGPVTKTNFVVRRQISFSWREVESPDYATYIANLRDIACPEQTIRDIIIADVNAMFSKRRATEVVTPEQQWWITQPDTNLLATSTEKIRVLEEERRALLGRLLGTGWESGDLVNLPRPSRQGVVLDGPVLGNLPAETKQAVEEISLRMQDQVQAYVDQQRNQGTNADPVELAKFHQQTRAELQRVLSPPQLEEFLLRYSQNANNLRTEFGQLALFNASSNEFREVFRATDTLNEQIQLLANSNDPASITQRKSLEEQRENAIRTALGPKRYDEYQMLHDPVYRDALAVAQQAGTPEMARIIYEISMATAEEQTRIRADTNLTAEQKNIELKRLELEQLQANTTLTGKELPPEPPVPPPLQKKVLVVGPGDSAATISLLYGVPISALRAANPRIDVTKLKPGDSINIPPNALIPGPAVR